MSQRNDSSVWERIKTFGWAVGKAMMDYSRADYCITYTNGYNAYVTEPEYQLILAEPELRRCIRRVDKVNH